MSDINFGRTEFTYSILKRNRETALKLLEQHKDVAHKDRAGYSDFYFAVQQGELEVVERMLELGADPKVETATGVTPLDAALMGAHKYPEERILKITQLLLEAGADPEHKNFRGRTTKDISKDIAKGPVSDYICNYSKEAKE